MNKFDLALEKSILALAGANDFLSYPVHTAIALAPRSSSLQTQFQRYSSPRISCSIASTAKSDILMFGLLNSYFFNLHKFY